MNAVVEDVRDFHQFTCRHFHNMTHLWFRSNKIFCAFFTELTNFIEKVQFPLLIQTFGLQGNGGVAGGGGENLPYAIY